MAPFNDYFANLGWMQGFVFLLIGLAFGAVLEMSGFGDSRKLAAQFYLREMTVLKVMFTAIVVAAVLVALATAFGLLDAERVFVNPTYLPSGIVGGLIMGVGFIVGGFCPGTSLVSAATGKLDGVAFVLGGLTGIFAFSETVSSFESFYQAAPLGRFTLPMWLDLPTGIVVLLLALMALAMFFGGEVAEQMVGHGKRWRDVRIGPRGGKGWLATAALVATSLLVLAKGQPQGEARWALVAAQEQPRLDARRVFVHPAEVVELKQDPALYVRILDLRSEAEFNLFHLSQSTRVTLAELTQGGVLRTLQTAPENTVFFLVANGESLPTRAFKVLRSAGVPNVCIVAGGLNGWLDHFALPECVAAPRQASTDEDLRYAFRFAVGERVDAAHPELLRREPPPCDATAAASSSRWPAVPFERKVELQRKSVVKGGCG